MNEKLKKLKDIVYEINDINKAIAVLGWDQETYMPKDGIAGRAEQISTLSQISHKKATSQILGDLIKSLKVELSELDQDFDDARLIKVLDRNYQKQIKVPIEFVAEFAKASSLGQQAWAEARTKSDFLIFAPHLKKIVELRKQYADFFAPYDHIYDPMLDDFEQGLKTSDVKAILDKLRSVQVNLVQKIKSKPEIDNSFFKLKFDNKKQWDFGVDVITKFGYDWDRGRQDKSEHPFTTDFGVNDVRITTRIDEYYLPSGLFGSMHEAGHGMYEQGIAQKLARTPLCAGASCAVHESQSRLWENIVGRSLPFWEYYYPILQKKFPSNLSDISLGCFYKAVNKVIPSMIRVEADEATYNLHIMLRTEIEIGLLDGSINVDDLPTVWNSKMMEYLGLNPKNDSEGVLQDIHWSMGYIGYFSTYTLGNLISAQIWEKINEDIPELNNNIKNGDFTELLTWLKENIHKHGAKFEPQELVEKVTGSKITPEPYLRYLTEKYSKIYDL